jgi:hypothetical protein
MSLWIAAVLGAVSIMVMSFAGMAVHKAAMGSEERMAREIDEVLAQLQTWYQQQADTIATSGITPSEAQLQAVLPRTYPGLRLAMSTSMASAGCSAGAMNCIPWRKIAAWYPATQPPATTTVQDGLPVSDFSGNAIWRVYSSQSWYFDRYAKTQTQLNTVARALMAFFDGRKGVNPVLGPDTNFWRTLDCAQPDANLPCVDNYTRLSGSGVAALMGLATADVTAPLGAVEFSNLQDSSTSAPFSVALRVSLPWGGQIRQTVLQP